MDLFNFQTECFNMGEFFPIDDITELTILKKKLVKSKDLLL